MSVGTLYVHLHISTFESHLNNNLIAKKIKLKLNIIHK